MFRTVTQSPHPHTHEPSRVSGTINVPNIRNKEGGFGSVLATIVLAPEGKSWSGDSAKKMGPGGATPTQFWCPVRCALIARDRWDDPDATQLVFQPRCVTGGHSHANRGYIMLSALGRDWIEYPTGLGVGRGNLKSPAAHSVLLINGISSSFAPASTHRATGVTTSPQEASPLTSFVSADLTFAYRYETHITPKNVATTSETLWSERIGDFDGTPWQQKPWVNLSYHQLPNWRFGGYTGGSQAKYKRAQMSRVPMQNGESVDWLEWGYKSDPTRQTVGAEWAPEKVLLSYFRSAGLIRGSQAAVRTYALMFDDVTMGKGTAPAGGHIFTAQFAIPMRTQKVRSMPAYASKVQVDGHSILILDAAGGNRRLLLRVLPFANPSSVRSVDVSTACQSIGKLYSFTVQKNCQSILRIKVTAASGINKLRLRLLMYPHRAGDTLPKIGGPHNGPARTGRSWAAGDAQAQLSLSFGKVSDSVYLGEDASGCTTVGIVRDARQAGGRVRAILESGLKLWVPAPTTSTSSPNTDVSTTTTTTTTITAAAATTTRTVSASTAGRASPIARWKLDDLYSNTIFESTGFGDTLGGTSCLPGQLFGQTHGGWPLSARWNPHAGIIHSPSGKGALRMHTGNGREYAVLAGCITNVLASGFIFKLQYLNNTCKSFRIFCAHF